MKSSGPWNLRGLRPEAREAARDAARRSGVSVGEWLNSVIRPADEDDEWSADLGHGPEERWQDRRHEEPERERYPSADRRRREPDDYWAQSRRQDEGEGERYRETNRRRRDRNRDDEPPIRREGAPHREDDRSSDQPYYDEPRRERVAQPRREREHRYREESHARGPRHEPPVFEPPFEPPRERPTPKPRNPRAAPAPPENDRDAFVDDAVAEITARQRALESGVGARSAPAQRTSKANVGAKIPAARRAVNKAIAELAAQPQRGTDLDVGAEVPAAHRAVDNATAELAAAPQRAVDVDAGAAAPAARRAVDNATVELAAAAQHAVDVNVPAARRAGDNATAELAAAPQRAIHVDVGAKAKMPQDAPDSELTAQIVARQRTLEVDTAATETSFGQREPLPLSSLPPEVPAVREKHPRPEDVSIQAVDLSGLEQQLRQITVRIEALRPSAELENAINGLRADLAEIGRSLTEALPRHAVESLEIEIKALAQRIDHSRQSGADTASLASLECGLLEVRETLRTLTPAESLIGFDETVRGLTRKVDAIAARDDPATLQQLETEIGSLRAIVSNVASNDALAKVAEEVRALAAKIDNLAASAATAPALSNLENRISVLTTALNASTEAGHAVPRELEKLLSGLIEKLEWVQLTHTDHTALAHLEDRIATLVKRLDASDSRLGLLEGVERGLADLLVHIEHLRGTKGEAEGVAGKPVAAAVIEQEVARTQDSLEAVQDTVEHVVDRLAMIESDLRVDRARTALSDEPMPEEAEVPPPLPLPAATVAAGDASGAPSGWSAEPQVETVRPVQAELAPRRLAVARAPIDPNLPPDHPLEPGFTAAGRARTSPSAAARIAESEAAIESKPPVIPDPRGGKSDFIAAARRAAREAAMAAPNNKSNAAFAGVSAPPKKMSDRLRTLMVAAAVVVIVVGGFHIVSRMLEDGGSGAPSPAATKPEQTKPPAAQIAPHVQPEPAPPQTLPPHVQTETPSPPASAAPAADPQSTPIPLPGEDSVQRPGAALSPSSVPSPAPIAGPGNQSKLDSGGGPPSVTAAARSNTPWSAADVTGSLPHAPAPHNAAPPPTTGTGDKLPAAIGSSALRSAALSGDPSAAYEVGVRLAEGRVVREDDEAAARWFERAAKKGLAPAQFRLASLYEKGIGVKKNLATARDLYRAAADKGHGKAMHNLAVLYAEGIAGPSDYRTAAEWFRKAADRGVTDSQYNLAVLYARGVGVEQNLAESYKWFFLAAKEGDKDAAQKRDEMAARLDEQSLAAARIEVEKWTPIPQPAEAIAVKAGWEPPSNPTSVAKPKARTSKASVPDAAKTD
jgi:localization factor PodJL